MEHFRRKPSAALLVAVLALTAVSSSSAQYASLPDAITALNLTTLLSAVQKANVTDAVLSHEGVILAPTNAAFDALLATLGAASLDDIPTTTLVSVLQYHLLPGSPALAPTTSPATTATALPGQGVTQSVAGSDGRTYLGGEAPGATATLGAGSTTTATAGTAVIQVIDAVLLPPAAGSTVASAAAATPALSSLVTLVLADPEVLALLSDPNTMVTVFAPTNDAFAATLAALNTTAEELAGTSTANRILKTHVVPSRPYLATQLPSGTTAGIATAADGQALTLTVTGGAVGVAAGGNTAPVSVVTADVKAGKSVVHVIDGVLLPSASAPASPSITAVLAATPTLSTLAAAVNAAGLGEALDDPQFSGVILAPTNDAFDTSLAALGLTLDQLVADVPTLQAIVKYHVLPSATPNATLTATPTPRTVPTLATTPLSFVTANPATPDLLYVGGAAPGATLDLSDPIIVGGATIYLVPHVVLPPVVNLTTAYESVAAAAAGNAPLSALLELVAADPTVAAALSDVDAMVTVFAPTNAAFESLLSALGTTLNDLKGSAVARRVLQAHVVVGRPLRSTDLSEGDNLATTLEGGELVVTARNGAVTVRGASNASPASVVSANIAAGKGVVHVVDGVLLPAGLELDVEEEGTYNSVMDAVEALGLTLLGDAINRTGLTDELSDPSLKAIVFAPDNTAITATLSGNYTTPSYDYIDEIPTELLSAVLLYHVVGSDQANPQLEVPGTGPMVMPTLLEGASLTVNPLTASSVYLGSVAPGGVVDVSTPVKAGNATIYLVSGLLLPPVVNTTVPAPTPAAALAARAASGLSLINALVDADEVVTALLSDPNLAATIFVPSDAAITATLAALNISAEDLVGTPTANAILAEHVMILRPFLASQIPAGTTSGLPTVAGGKGLTVTASSSGVTVLGPGNTSPARVIETDIRGGKSVIHVIDGVLLPASTDRKSVV